MASRAFGPTSPSAEAAFQLTHVQTGINVLLSAAVSTDSLGRTVVTLGFSGFNTVMQAVECGLPVVTLRGEFLRGRLGSGIKRARRGARRHRRPRRRRGGQERSAAVHVR